MNTKEKNKMKHSETAKEDVKSTEEAKALTIESVRRIYEPNTGVEKNPLDFSHLDSIEDDDEDDWEPPESYFDAIDNISNDIMGISNHLDDLKLIIENDFPTDNQHAVKIQQLIETIENAINEIGNEAASGYSEP